MEDRYIVPGSTEDMIDIMSRCDWCGSLSHKTEECLTGGLHLVEQ